MDISAFLSRYRELLGALAQAPRDVPTWVALAHHIDGRKLNFEECLASTEELEAIDENELVPWSKYIWEHVLELAPEHLDALELVVEYRAEVLEDPDGAAPVLASLLRVVPEHPRGLHFAVVLASLNEDLDEARRRLLQLCETSPATAIADGTFDYFDENDLLFLAELAPKIVEAIDEIDAMGELGGYERSLRALIASLPEGGPARLKRFDAASVPPDVGDVAVSELTLSFTAQRCLEAEGVSTVAEIVGLSDEVTHQFPLAVVRQIKGALEERGLRFPDIS